MTEQHRFTLWTTLFFVQQCAFNKTITPKNDMPTPVSIFGDDWWCRLNEEVAILRSLLGSGPCVPSYALIRDTFPRDSDEGPGARELPWRFRLNDSTSFTHSQLQRYVRRRSALLNLNGSRGWNVVVGSMRRFAIAWENSFRADTLADVVSALESLVVDDNKEVGYKFRVRTAHVLGRTEDEKKEIITNLRDAYEYRSKVAHGAYVFDDPREWETAKRLKGTKGKHGNPFHDVNEIHRLTQIVADYFRRFLARLIDSGDLTINWSKHAL